MHKKQIIDKVAFKNKANEKKHVYEQIYWCPVSLYVTVT